MGNSTHAAYAIDTWDTSDAVPSSWKSVSGIWALQYYLNHTATHLLVVGNTLPHMDSHGLQGVCSQQTDTFSSQNLASSTAHVITAEIHVELCLGKALRTSLPDSLVLLPKSSQCSSSPFEALRVVRSTGSTFFTSCCTKLSYHRRLQAAGSWLLCCTAPFVSLGEVVPMLCVLLGLWSEMSGAAAEGSVTNEILQAIFRGNSTELY